MFSADSSIGVILSDLEARLQIHTDTPHLDAQVLIAHIIHKPRSWVLAHPEAFLTLNQRKDLVQAAFRLENGEPLPYLLGHWEFYGLDFLISPDVLIPRPETELLITHAIDWLCANPSQRWAADIATGSGCIAVTLASKFPDLRLLAADISLPALNVARSNAHRHAVTNQITFLPADLLDFTPSAPFDLICTNLPYIPTPLLPSLKVSAHEPTLALDGGQDGLGLLRRLLQSAPPRLAPGGLLLLEIEASQGSSVRTIAQQAFPTALIHIHPDIAGHDRLLEIQL